MWPDFMKESDPGVLRVAQPAVWVEQTGGGGAELQTPPPAALHRIA